MCLREIQLVLVYCNVLSRPFLPRFGLPSRPGSASFFHESPDLYELKNRSVRVIRQRLPFPVAGSGRLSEA